MKRFLFALSILFCTTVFANNSFAADCPSIKADNAIESIPVKLLDETKNGEAYLGTATVDIKGDCVAPIFIADNKGGKYIGLMLRYPDGTDTDYSDAYVSQLIEVCSVAMLQELMSDPSEFEDKYLSPVSGDRVRFSGPIGKNSSIVDYNNLGIVSYSCSSSGGDDPAPEEPEDPAQECGGGEFWDGYDCLQCESYFGSEYWGDGTDCYLKDDQYCEDYYGIGYTWDSTNTDCVCNGYLGTDDICYTSGGDDPSGSSTTNYPDLMTTIGASEAATGYGSLSLDGELTRNTDTYGIANTGEFVVDYGNKGKIHGYASCSTRSATDPWVGNNGDYVLQNDSTIATLPNSSGQYCYCQLDGYTENGSQTTVDLSAPWVFAADENSSEDCGYTCAEECTTLLGYGQSAARSYRSAVFGSVARGSNTPASSPFRFSRLTPDSADGTLIASGAYAKGAYNANVGNINTALTYVEDSSVETIKHATVSAENVSLSVAGFTPAGTIDVDSSNATVSGTVNVANTVAMLSEWGTNSTENGTLSGSQQVSITNGAVTGMTGTFSGPASGQLSGTGTLSNASVHVNNWVPVNPQQ